MSKILGSICSLERLYFLKHYYPTHGDSIGGIHFGNEQIKEADHIGMKMYAWNDFLKVVGTSIVGYLQFNLLKHLDRSIQSQFCINVYDGYICNELMF